MGRPNRLTSERAARVIGCSVRGVDNLVRARRSSRFACPMLPAEVVTPTKFQWRRSSGKRITGELTAGRGAFRRFRANDQPRDSRCGYVLLSA